MIFHRYTILVASCWEIRNSYWAECCKSEPIAFQLRVLLFEVAMEMNRFHVQPMPDFKYAPIRSSLMACRVSFKLLI